MKLTIQYNDYEIAIIEILEDRARFLKYHSRSDEFFQWQERHIPISETIDNWRSHEDVMAVYIEI